MESRLSLGRGEYLTWPSVCMNRSVNSVAVGHKEPGIVAAINGGDSQVANTGRCADHAAGGKEDLSSLGEIRRKIRNRIDLQFWSSGVLEFWNSGARELG
jgi:hypothetical protein